MVRLSRSPALSCASNSCPQLEQGGDKSEFLLEAWTSARRGDHKRTPNELMQEDYTSFLPKPRMSRDLDWTRRQSARGNSDAFPALWPRFETRGTSAQAYARKLLTSVSTEQAGNTYYPRALDITALMR